MNQNNNNFILPSSSESESDLIFVWRILSRQWKTFLIITSTSLACSFIYLLSVKPTWKGVFQIVLAERNLATNSFKERLDNPTLIKFLGVNNKENNLDTEVEILRSPLVLKPVFLYYKQYKSNKSSSDSSKLRYVKWVKDYLDIGLEEGTSILNLSLYSKDKEIILPLLQMISSQYQTYSSRDRLRGISQSINYLDEQISLYKRKSSESFRLYLQFSNKNDLNLIDSINTDKSPSIESIRIQAANKIRSIDEQLRQLKSLDFDLNTFIPISDATLDTFKSIKDLNEKIVLSRLNYTSKDPELRRLENKRDNLLVLLKNQSIAYLTSKRAEAVALQLSAERPKGIFIKWRELKKQANRDESTLKELEYQRQVIGLEKARQQDPWELISQPFILDRPVYPSYFQTFLLSILGSLLFSFSFVVIKENKKGIIFNKNYLISIIPKPLLCQLRLNDSHLLRSRLNLLFEGIFTSNEFDSLAIIPVGNVSSEFLHNFRDNISNFIISDKIKIINKIVEKPNSLNNIILLVSIGVDKNQLISIIDDLYSNNINLLGWIYINPYY